MVPVSPKPENALLWVASVYICITALGFMCEVGLGRGVTLSLSIYIYMYVYAYTQGSRGVPRSIYSFSGL